MDQSNAMSGGMPGQGNPGMNNGIQRPQPGSMMQQLHAKVIQDLRAGLGQLPPGWQAMFDLRDRALRIMQLITLLRQIHGDVNKCLSIAQLWETKVMQSSSSAEQYKDQMQMKFDEITARRKQHAGQMNLPGNNMGMMQNNMMNMQNGMMSLQNNGMMNAPNMQNNGMGNMNFPNNGGMGGMGMQGGRMAQAQNQNPMAQLQRPMQPSQMPMQQQSGTLDPSALQMPQQIGQQQSSQQQPSQQNQAMGQSNQPPQPSMNQGGQARPNQINQQEVQFLAKQMMDSTTPELKAELRTKFINNLNDTQKAQIAQGGGDPLTRFFMMKAQADISKRRQQQMGAGGPIQNKTEMNNAGGANMQVNNNGPQRPPSQTSGQNIDFSSIMGQQANALKLQDAGEQVVPASSNTNNNNGANNMNFGGQMNMPQNINPQMLSGANNNQGQQGNGSMNQNQMQALAMHRAQQERMNKQVAAQQHAMASRQQHSQLQGQPGGLHTPNGFGAGGNGQANSPAMSMLNRPMAPPAQTTPGTPQANRQQPMQAGQMNNGISQLQQHHTNMLNQNSQQQQQQQQMNQAAQNQYGPQFQDMLQRVPPQFRQKLSQLPPEQARVMLQRFANQTMGARPNGQQGMPNGMNMGQPPQNNQSQTGGPQQTMGNAVPGFNAQPPPNQRNNMESNPQLQREQQLQQLRMRSAAMDVRPFPRPVLTQLNIAVPPNVTMWGQLKQFVQQNSPQGTIEKVQHQQQMWFQNHPDEFKAAMNAMVQRVRMNSMGQQGQQNQQVQQGQQQGVQAQQGQMQQNQMQSQQNAAAQQAPSMPDQPAPQAQMVPPAPMMQPQGQGMQQAVSNQAPKQWPAVPNISAQDLAMFRAKVPQAGGMSDDQIRLVLARQKIENLRRQQQQQRQSQSLPAGQPQNASGQSGAAPPTNNAMPQQRMPQPPAGSTGAGQSKQQQQSKNDLGEFSSQPAAQAASQAPAMQKNVSQSQNQQPPGPMKHLTPEQVQKLSEKDRQVYLQQVQRSVQLENLRKAQGQVGAGNVQGPPTGQQPDPQNNRVQMSPANAEKIRNMQVEVTRSFVRGPPVQADATTIERAKAHLNKLYKPLRQIPPTLGAALELGFEEDILKNLMRAILNVQANAIDAAGNFKDYLSLTLDDLKAMEQLVVGYMHELRRRKLQGDQAKQAANNMQAQPQPQAQGAKQQQPGPTPTMARSGSQQNQVRKASASTKAPPAPTENKTFDWAAPSPHGVPKYEPGRNELTPDKLKFPPGKKRKVDQAGSQASTPAAQANTPAAATGASPVPATGKAQSPEQMRKTAAQLKAEAEKLNEEKKFHCTDSTCEAALRGFETEEQLKQHQASQHQPIDDPLEYLLSSAANALGVDQDGKVLQKKQKDAPPGKVQAAPKSKQDAKKQQASDVKAQPAPEKSLTLSEAMSQKLGIPTELEETTGQASNDEDFLGPLLWPPEEDELGFISATPLVIGKMYEEGWRDDLEHPGTWVLRPDAKDPFSSPELTPSEGSQSSHNSDVSQNDTVNFHVWLENMDMLGEGASGMPEGMLPLYEQLENINMMKDVEDAQAANTDEEKRGAEGDVSKKRKAPEMWEPPIEDYMQSFFDDANLVF